MTENEESYQAYLKKLRWVLLIPCTAVIPHVMVIMCIPLVLILQPLAGLFIMLWPALTAVVWVTTSYKIAPSHRLPVVWVSFICGAIWVAEMGGWISGTAWAAGFVTTVYYSWALRQATTTEAQ